MADDAEPVPAPTPASEPETSAADAEAVAAPEEGEAGDTVDGAAVAAEPVAADEVVVGAAEPTDAEGVVVADDAPADGDGETGDGNEDTASADVVVPAEDDGEADAGEGEAATAPVDGDATAAVGEDDAVATASGEEGGETGETTDEAANNEEGPDSEAAGEVPAGGDEPGDGGEAEDVEVGEAVPLDAGDSAIAPDTAVDSPMTASDLEATASVSAEPAMPIAVDETGLDTTMAAASSSTANFDTTAMLQRQAAHDERQRLKEAAMKMEEDRMREKTRAEYAKMEMQTFKLIQKIRAKPEIMIPVLVERLEFIGEDGNYHFPGDHTRDGIVTVEGRASGLDAIRVLRETEPAPAFTVRAGMIQAARDLVYDLGPSGAVGHTGSDNTSPFERLSQYGDVAGRFSEIVRFGHYRDALDVVADILVDDGVTTRHNRRSLLDPRLRVIGICIGHHQVHGTMVTLTLAADYYDDIEKQSATAEDAASKKKKRRMVKRRGRGRKKKNAPPPMLGSTLKMIRDAQKANRSGAVSALEVAPHGLLGTMDGMPGTPSGSEHTGTHRGGRKHKQEPSGPPPGATAPAPGSDTWDPNLKDRLSLSNLAIFHSDQLS